MPPRTPKPKPSSTEYKAIAEQWAKAKRAKEAEDTKQGLPPVSENVAALEKQREKLDARRKKAYEKRWWWTVAFWTWLLGIHAVGLWLFTSGFLLTRLVLEEKSNCTQPPIENSLGLLNVDGGCWHPKSFDRAVIVLIDALRYDFTVPEDPEQAHHFHNAFPFLYETALALPQNAFLRPFIADPPTATLQRLKGLTTGTLPTFVDLGSSFGGTAIEEDNLLMQLRDSGKKIAQIGDDTWWALFPGYFEPNISKAYDSFNVWDLHTVDNGVIDNIFPLMAPEKKNEWDLLIGHCLGVDHAGHRYGPDHPAMNSKLQQMDGFIRKVVESLDDNTLLVVMGDHGMDSKGDHGGESDDEVEAALWMYSKRPFFGRTSPEFATPPANAKIRPVNQIDLVPTLALLLGIPIPFNNLGAPIEEAFAGVKGNDWRNLAAVSRVTSAGIEKYQAAYLKAQGISQKVEPGSPAALWEQALAIKKGDADIYNAFAKFQAETLQVCKGLWARFDIPRMMAGIVISALGVLILMMYSARDPDEDFIVNNDAELDYAENKLELMALRGDIEPLPEHIYHKELLSGLWDARILFTLAVLIGVAVYRQHPVDGLVGFVVVILLTGVGSSLHDAGQTILNILPNSFWGWLAVVFTVSQSIGFASNSYTIWEDSILLFFITTFGVVSGVAAFRIESRVKRAMAVYHSIAFVALGRLASYSKLCREEQMPYCTSTYYASAASSTSAPWQLIIPFIVFIVLPTIIKTFLTPTRSYEGLAPKWIGYVFRSGLFLAAAYWLIDAADNGGWLTGRLPEGTLKTVGVYVAQMVLALAFVAGSTAFVWAPPCVSILSAPSPSGQQVIILGYANAIGARYLLLPLNILVACLLLSKPMGFGALAIMMWQVLSLAEILDFNGLKTNPIGPIMLALLGNFYYFKTGHQAVLSSIQWDAAFIPLFSIRYPWSPIVVTLNTFAGQILAAASIPLLALWKVGPKQKGVLETVARSIGVFIAYFAVEALATMSWAGWLRRHLMLYRIFCPRFMLAGVLLLVLDVAVVVITLLGVRSNTLSLGEMFGWAD